MAKTVGLYLYPETQKALSTRGDNRSAVINRDLGRLYELYGRAIREIPLALDEARLIVDMCNGTIFDARTAPLLWASVEDACHLDGLDEKWGIDGPVLVEKLKGLTQLQALALADAAEQFWALPDGERDLDKDVRKFFHVKP